jgi:hypothetical protein
MKENHFFAFPVAINLHANYNKDDLIRIRTIFGVNNRPLCLRRRVAGG